ncbi:hypothetical protein MMAD_18730 [Mycolicibacterium madagascariense]|uniref:2'-5' RNA ligase n=1 Tax=Mycolicibacterium madagascariense TaxID=212765 RepID=A0A7I7XEL6_9MYCO|nr:hypothetical protein [Mycolicibacterium madagascariense]MCV7015284.1 hypothetical protein [Mycolicibacterium madagascariense]BBZ27578.1 hypothetical protein MMAD_18730 [Mycolicibacterium madagascariense]
MTLVTLDAVLILPPPLRRLAVDHSSRLADAMEAHGGACFRLGADFPDRVDGPCEPHVSLFMMAVEDHEVPKVARAVAEAAQTVGPVSATAVEYRHNHEGAPEVFFARSDEFRDVQRAVVAGAEPLRGGRLRELGPGGERLADIVADPDPEDPARVRQLRRYGFDDVSDELDDRFDPHVTLTWPRDETTRVDLGLLPPVADFNGVLTDLALFGMSPNGTCTTRYGSWTLTGGRR